MTNEEMQKAMKFILKMDRQTTVKLDRLGIKIRAISVVRNRSEKRWEQTEKRIRALLAKAKTRERRIADQRRRVRPLRKTTIDKRLEALANLLQRQIKEGQKPKP